MIWKQTHRCHYATRLLADRHYNRQSVGADNFVPPGRCLVLLAEDEQAFWVTSWPFAEYVRHAWAGAWMCSAFRNEVPLRVADGGKKLRSSELIRQAVAATRFHYGEPPDLGMVTFVNEAKVKEKANPGFCYLRAGFKPCGRTEGGLVALQLLPDDMPTAEAAHGVQLSLLDAS